VASTTHNSLEMRDLTRASSVFSRFPIGSDWAHSQRIFTNPWPSEADELPASGDHNLMELMETEFRNDCVAMYNTLFPKVDFLHYKALMNVKVSATWGEYAITAGNNVRRRRREIDSAEPEVGVVSAKRVRTNDIEPIADEFCRQHTHKARKDLSVFYRTDNDTISRWRFCRFHARTQSPNRT